MTTFKNSLLFFCIISNTVLVAPETESWRTRICKNFFCCSTNPSVIPFNNFSLEDIEKIKGLSNEQRLIFERLPESEKSVFLGLEKDAQQVFMFFQSSSKDEEPEDSDSEGLPARYYPADRQIKSCASLPYKVKTLIIEKPNTYN